ncbi:hypothetical protein [Methylobacter sp. YRD-M1]|uniref:hypothetical protein n=1 Tax=Methylobacter sp. YRD-M1 TaxID=2911520 RepID=UPI00227D30E4|nr:hypothetical protein [Methylobacter sp. YRD-M1]WAK03853.1 hypothetical protein LZ558_08730 [Methylobacter sp. YRD-M1]
MPRILNHAAIIAWLLGISFIVKGTPAVAEQPAIEEILSVQGMNKAQINELAQGQPVIYALSEDRSDEIAAGIAWYLPIPLAKVAGQLRTDNPDLLDVDVTAHGILMTHNQVDALPPVVLSDEEIEALLDAEAGEQFNLSSDEIESFKTLRRTVSGASDKAIRDTIEQRYREMLFDRFEAYRRDGTHAIAPYARDNNQTVKPSAELDQAANASVILARYFPALHKAWINYPAALPPQTNEVFQWVEKNVQNRPAFILRHHVNYDWNGGALVLTREFYASHSYNASQWVTGCLAYRGGTVVFQQVRSYADQLSGVATDVRHLIGRKLLKNKMLKSFERLCGALRHCH